MKIVSIKAKNSQKIAVDILQKGGILIFPTDTVYGIGCLLNNLSIKKLYKIKQRKFTQPTSVLLTKNLYDNFRLNGKSTIKIPTKVIKEFLLGKVTIILPTNIFKIDFPKVITKDNKIGIRLPQYKWLEKVINLTGPLVASSANIKGKPAPANYRQIDKKILTQADLVIKTTSYLKGIASKVFDPENKDYLRH
ncbi:MAG: Sua5/YciO/YrdC/YwlC family protein [Patescibacteria group bacterium]